MVPFSSKLLLRTKLNPLGLTCSILIQITTKNEAYIQYDNNDEYLIARVYFK